MKRFVLKNVKEDMFDFVINFILDGNDDGLVVEPVKEDFTIFICSHDKNDSRCGFCGPIIFDEFNKLINNNLKLYHVSHVGGHKYAANVLVFPPGNWYGYIKQEDVPKIVESLNHPGSVDLNEKLRGCMGVTSEKKTDNVKSEKKEKIKTLKRTKTKTISVKDIPLFYFEIVLAVLLLLFVLSFENYLLY